MSLMCRQMHCRLPNAGRPIHWGFGAQKQTNHLGVSVEAKWRRKAWLVRVNGLAWLVSWLGSELVGWVRVCTQLVCFTQFVGFACRFSMSCFLVARLFGMEVKKQTFLKKYLVAIVGLATNDRHFLSISNNSPLQVAPTSLDCVFSNEKDETRCVQRSIFTHYLQSLAPTLTNIDLEKTRMPLDSKSETWLKKIGVVSTLDSCKSNSLFTPRIR